MTGKLKDILFLDIETVRGSNTMDELPDRIQDAWRRKAAYYQRNADSDVGELYHEKAAMFAEFGNIIVIGLGFFHETDNGLTLRMKAVCGTDERLLLLRFREILAKFDTDEVKLCAHNGKQFDFPYISRRMLVQGIDLPEPLRFAGKKPWEINHLDTMELWRFGDFKHFVSLELLAALFGIDSSKSEFDGSAVGDKFYIEQDVESIAAYCLRDVEVTAGVYLHLSGMGNAGFETIKEIEYMKPDKSDE